VLLLPVAINHPWCHGINGNLGYGVITDVNNIGSNLFASNNTSNNFLPMLFPLENSLSMTPGTNTKIGTGGAVCNTSPGGAVCKGSLEQ
jgi:hypothetical protein